MDDETGLTFTSCVIGDHVVDGDVAFRVVVDGVVFVCADRLRLVTS